jgi:hypothetical protein
MPLIWMRPTVCFTKTGLVETERKCSTRQMMEVYWWPHCHTWVTGSHICQAVPWRNSLREDSSWDHLGPAFLCAQALQLSKAVCERCCLCARNNPQPGPRCKYLLVFVYTFSGWVKAFPTWTKKAWEVARCLLKKIIPQFKIPVSIGSDNGLAFVAEVV